jgi:hypothetical protein
MVAPLLNRLDLPSGIPVQLTSAEGRLRHKKAPAWRKPSVFQPPGPRSLQLAQLLQQVDGQEPGVVHDCAVLGD